MSEAFCADCGALRPDFDAALAVKDGIIQDLERELRAKRATITKLRGDRDSQRHMDPLAKDAERVFDYWRSSLAPRAREFTGERFDKVAARLRAGATVEELCKAIDGIALKPYVNGVGRSKTGKPDERMVDLALICRDEPHVQRYISYLEGSESEKAKRGNVVPRERLAQMQAAIDAPAVLDRLRELRGWRTDVVVAMGLGLDGDRVVFPIYDAEGALVGLHRYQPNPDLRGSSPKLVAQGQRDLFPPPETVQADNCWLVEGEPDAVAMRSAGLPAVGVPGVATWKEGWAERFERFERVYICFDCDEEGRKAADQRQRALGKITEAKLVDLAPSREDGFDVGELLLKKGESTAPFLAGLTSSGKRSGSVAPIRRQDGPQERRFDVFCKALEDHDCRVQHRHQGHATSQCPRHDDRVPSLSVTEGEDGRVLLHCFAGCEYDEICDALDLEPRDLFERTG